MQVIDLLRPARVSGQPPVFGIEERLGRKGEHFIGTTTRAKEKRGEAASGDAGHDDAFRASTRYDGRYEGVNIGRRITDPGDPELIPASPRVSQKRSLGREP